MQTHDENNLLASLPGLSDGTAAHFQEPWQAQVFALTVKLNESGLFAWSEWADVFSRHLAMPGAKADASDYFHHWVNALVELLAAKDIVTAEAVGNMAETWVRAANNTPHGQPILLENAD